MAGSASPGTTGRGSWWLGVRMPLAAPERLVGACPLRLELLPIKPPALWGSLDPLWGQICAGRCPGSLEDKNT